MSHPPHPLSAGLASPRCFKERHEACGEGPRVNTQDERADRSRGDHTSRRSGNNNKNSFILILSSVGAEQCLALRMMQ